MSVGETQTKGQCLSYENNTKMASVLRENGFLVKVRNKQSQRARNINNLKV